MKALAKYVFYSALIGLAVPIMYVVLAVGFLQLGNITGAGHNVGFQFLKALITWTVGEKTRLTIYLAGAFALSGFLSVLLVCVQIEKGTGVVGLVISICGIALLPYLFAYFAPNGGLVGPFWANYFFGFLICGFGIVASVYALFKLKQWGIVTLRVREIQDTQST